MTYYFSGWFQGNDSTIINRKNWWFWNEKRKIYILVFYVTQILSLNLFQQQMLFESVLDSCRQFPILTYLAWLHTKSYTRLRSVFLKKGIKYFLLSGVFSVIGYKWHGIVLHFILSERTIFGYSIPDTFAARVGETKIGQQSMFWWAIATPNRALALERGSLFCSENTRGKEEEKWKSSVKREFQG